MKTRSVCNTYWISVHIYKHIYTYIYTIYAQVSTGGVPRLSGHSHLALATLQNAYSDLHLAIEFRPEAGDGVLLITGQVHSYTAYLIYICAASGRGHDG